MRRYSSPWVQQALGARPTPPHKLPNPIPRAAAAAPQAPQPRPALTGSRQRPRLRLPRTQGSTAAPARAQHAPGTARHRKGTMRSGIQLTQVLCSIIIVT